MADLKLEILLKAVDAASAVFARVGSSIDGVNKAMERTARLRAAALNIGLAGTALTGAGISLGLPLKEAVESAEDFEDHIARLGTALGNVPGKAALLETAEAAIKAQSIATGYSVDQLTESVYEGLSGFLNMSQSMAVMRQAAVLARGTTGDLTETTKMLTSAMLNFSDPTKNAIQNATMLADKFAALQTQFKFSNLDELIEGTKYAAGAMKAFHVSLDSGLASMAALSAAGLQGAQAGTAFREVLTELLKKSDKLGINILYTRDGMLDWSAVLGEIQTKYGGTVAGQRRLTEELGLRAGPAIALLLQNLSKYHVALDGITNSSGAAARAQQEFEKRGTLAWQKFGAAVHVLWVDIGETIAPTLADIAQWLTRVTGAIARFAEAHPTITRIGVGFAAILSAVLLLGGALAVVVGAIGGFVSFIPVVASLAGAFGTVGVAIGAVTAPITLVVAGVLALGAAAYEIYKHWDSVKPLLVDFWSVINPEHLFGNLLPRFFEWGGRLIESFAKGILHAAALPGEAVASIAHKIMNLLPHSPAKEGPLRDLNRVRIVETIAQTIKPAPLVAALERVMLPALQVLGGVSLPASSPPARGMPHEFPPTVPVRSVAGAQHSHVTITLHYSPTLNGTTPADFDARKHADEITQRIWRNFKDLHFRESRLRFDHE